MPLLAWHPGDSNSVCGHLLAGQPPHPFPFHRQDRPRGGRPPHGPQRAGRLRADERGRASYLREHVIPEARIHYAYLDVGGDAPNVVQGTATTYYMIRAPKIKQVLELCERVFDVARGAALMTGTEMTYEIKQGLCDYMPNKALSELAAECFRQAGAPDFDEADFEPARKFRATLSERERSAPPLALAQLLGMPKAMEIAQSGLCDVVLPYAHMPQVAMPGSTDVGDVSWVCPTAQVNTACYASGTPGHSWQLVAQGKAPVAHAAMLQAGRVMAGTAIDLFESPELLEKAKAEHAARVGDGYVCPIPAGVKPRPMGAKK